MESRADVQDVSAAAAGGGFRHDALFYDGIDDFLARTTPFILDAVRSDEPILVVVSGEKVDLLRDALGTDAGAVRFADMAQVGQNPARIIPAWREFVAEQEGTPATTFRGVGEPIWASRSADELVECERHEALLNLAFDGSPSWWLACPYDTVSLAPAVLDEARRNHPSVIEGSERRASGAYRGLEEVAEPFALPLPEAAQRPRELAFTGHAGLPAVRAMVADAAAVHGLDVARADDLILVANEVATNSLRHGGGSGRLRIWSDDGSLVCEIADAGRIDDPLVGRGQPAPTQLSGFGLWLANQLCDLVQIRTFATGTVVRLHVRR